MKNRWTLRDLVDFEALLAREEPPRTLDEATIRAAIKGMEGAEARRAGMRVWLEDQRRGERELPGEVWSSGRFIVGGLVVVGMFLLGTGVMTGLLDRERMAFHVPMVVGVAVGLQLLVLIFGASAWLLRGRYARSLGFVPGLLAWLVGRFGGGNNAWWKRLKLDGGRAWQALAWNLVRLTQAGAVMFSLGLMAGLLGCIWFLEVGFYWESTTPVWMARRIYEVCSVLYAPWAWAFPAWAPGFEEIAATRWVNGGILAGRMQSAATWYSFLFAAIFVWGLLPRLLLWLFALMKQRRAMGALDFQAKRHRELWRELTGTRRMDVSEEPLDGVLVLDVGGTGLKAEGLRGFLLRRLRVNPGQWYEVGVWDEKGEEAAAKSIRRAPAGVVLLAEGWALSPPRMSALHSQVRSLAGADTVIYFLVVNADSDGKAQAVKDEEKGIWRDFVDGLADPSAEVFFYEKEEAAA